MAKTKYPEKFTFSAIVNFVAEKNELTKSKAREIIEDYLDVVNAGIFKGARVPVGNIGKVFIRVKPATKARKGRNPATGEEITIAAKPKTKVPKFSFARAFKEAVKKSK